MLGEVKQLQKQGTEEMLAQLRDLLEQQKRREEVTLNPNPNPNPSPRPVPER